MSTTRRAKEYIEKFNEKYPVGSQVHWRSTAHAAYPHELMTVKTPAYDSHGQPVVFFEQRSGFCSIWPDFVDYEK